MHTYFTVGILNKFFKYDVLAISKTTFIFLCLRLYCLLLKLFRRGGFIGYFSGFAVMSMNFYIFLPILHQFNHPKTLQPVVLLLMTAKSFFFQLFLTYYFFQHYDITYKYYTIISFDTNT